MLYAWCRYCDDVIDGQTLGHEREVLAPDEVQRRLEGLYARTRAALAGEPTDDPAFAAFREVAGRRAIPEQYAIELIDGFAMDVAGRRYQTIEDTLDYKAVSKRLKAFVGDARFELVETLAERCAKDLEDEKMKWTAPLAAMVRAGVAEHRGQAEVAVRHYRDAVQGFQAAGMTMREAAARLRLGELGGEQGRALVGEALARMNEQNVRNPIRFSLALAPISSKY
jgi:dihydroneopterin aldolase